MKLYVGTFSGSFEDLMWLVWNLWTFNFIWNLRAFVWNLYVEPLSGTSICNRLQQTIPSFYGQRPQAVQAVGE